MPKLDTSFQALKGDYASLWKQMKIRRERAADVRASANRILENRERYRAVEAETGVPWYVIGIIHKMECNCNFRQHLHNGDPLTARTRLVPKGRPKTGNPPFEWEFSAADALRYDGLDQVTGWSIERIAWCLEKYNGFGSRLHGVPSAYLWSFTSVYARGKFVSDGIWDAQAVSQQSGGMALLSALMAADDSIRVSTEAEWQAQPETVEVNEDESLPYVNTGPAPAQTTTCAALARVSRKANILEWVKTWSGAGGIGAGGLTLGGTLGLAQEVSDGIKTLLADHILLVIFLICAVLCYGAWVLQRMMVQDVAEGRYIPSKGAPDVAP